MWFLVVFVQFLQYEYSISKVLVAIEVKSVHLFCGLAWRLLTPIKEEAIAWEEIGTVHLLKRAMCR